MMKKSFIPITMCPKCGKKLKLNTLQCPKCGVMIPTHSYR